jgi:hypothetical protein
VVLHVIAWPQQLGNVEVLALDPEAMRGIHAVIHHAAAVSRLHSNSVIAAAAASVHREGSSQLQAEEAISSRCRARAASWYRNAPIGRAEQPMTKRLSKLVCC